MPVDASAPSPARTTVASTVAFVVCAVPAFLVGGSGVFLREDLGFDATGLGLAVAGLVQGLLLLVIVLTLGGAVNSVAEPASNLALARRVVRQPATMFGIKQAAMPMAALLAGASVPLIGLTVGWRWTFVLGAARCTCRLRCQARRHRVGFGRGSRR